MAPRNDFAALDARKEKPRLRVVRAKPWERQEGESAGSWRGFEVFRDLGPSRTVAQASALLNLSRKGQQIHCSTNHWVDRAKAWDAENSRRRMEGSLSEIEKMGRRHARYAQESLIVLTIPVKHLIARIRDDPKFRSELDAMTAPQLIGLIAKVSPAIAQLVQVERLARGASTANLSVQVHDQVADSLLDDPESIRLATELFSRVTGGYAGIPGHAEVGEDDASGSGDLGIGGPMEDVSAPREDQ